MENPATQAQKIVAAKVAVSKGRPTTHAISAKKKRKRGTLLGS